MREWTDIPNLPERDLERANHVFRYLYAGDALEGRYVLDCACGMGYGTDILSRTCSAVGVDVDPEAVALARVRYQRGLFWCADIHAVDFTPFDALACFETLEHLTEPWRVIDSLPANIHEIVASAPIREHDNPAHRTKFTPESFRALIERGGFRIKHEFFQDWPGGQPMYLVVHGVRP